MTPDDERLARDLIAERRKLKRQLRQLTNAGIANKLGVSVRDVEWIAKTAARGKG